MRHESPAFEHIHRLKQELHAAFPDVRSSHLAEATAAALGFGTYAALLSAAKAQPSSRLQVSTTVTAHEAFNARLRVVSGAADNVDPVLFEHALRNAASLVAIGDSAKPEPVLLQVSALDRCHAYGIVMQRDGVGRIFATHNVAGVLGPFASLDEAAHDAVARWL